MDNETNEISLVRQSCWTDWPPSPALPRAWIERLFGRLQGRFGSGFIGKFASGEVDADGRDTGIENAMRVWAEELAGHTGDEVSRGLASRYQYPPSLDQFQAACRPQFDFAGSYAEAQIGMQRRENGEHHEWSGKAVYWSAVQFSSFELRNQGWQQAKDRWTRLMAENMAKQSLPDIPPIAPALPKPINKGEAERHLAKLYSIVGGKRQDSDEPLKKVL